MTSEELMTMISRNKAKSIVAIDPDVDKNGVAIYNRKTRRLQIESIRFPELVDKFREQDPNEVAIYVEAGWLNKTHFHITYSDSKASAAAKGNSTGRNHEVGRKLIECAEHYGLEVVEVKPLKKHWRGHDGKITHDELSELCKQMHIEGFPNRTNQEERDAILIAITR